VGAGMNCRALQNGLLSFADTILKHFDLINKTFTFNFFFLVTNLVLSVISGPAFLLQSISIKINWLNQLIMKLACLMQHHQNSDEGLGSKAEMHKFHDVWKSGVFVAHI
jgi:hypothetical protein